MNLFEINSMIERCFVDDDEVIDIETGEIFDASYLDNLEMQRDTKIENIAKWIKNLESDADQLEIQKKIFERRLKSTRNKCEQLKSYLSACLNNSKWEASDKSIKISFRKSEAISITDITKIPAKWFIAQEPKLDQSGIKKMIKAGTAVDGAELVTRSNIQIK